MKGLEPKKPGREGSGGKDLTSRLWPDCVGNRLSIRKKAEFGAL
jgi:hypothetical protein